MANVRGSSVALLARDGRISWSGPVAGGILVVLAAGFIAYTFLCLYRDATSRILPFDAPYNAAVARTLALEGTYGVWYDGKLEICPVTVSTGPPMLVTIAAAYRCFGDEPFVPNVVSLVLVFSTLIVALLILWPLPLGESPGKAFSLLVALFLLFGVTAKYWEHRLLFVPLGDVWTGLLLLCAAASLGRILRGGLAADWATFSGFTLALAFSTKFIAIMPAAILAGFLFCSVLYGVFPRSALAYFIAAFAGTWLCFELFRLVCLGSLQAYTSNWVAFWKFFRVAGSGAGAGKPPLRQLFFMHLSPYTAELGWAGLVLLVPLLLASLSLYRLWRKQAAAEDWVGVLTATQIASFLTWWFFISSADWLRHIIPALVLLPFCCHLLITGTTARLRSNLLRAILLLGWPVAVGVSCALSSSTVWSLPRLEPTPDPRMAAVREVAQYLECLKAREPESRFFRPNWWDHWDIQLFTHMRFSCPPFPSPDKAITELRPHDYLISSEQSGIDGCSKIPTVFGDKKQRLVFSNSHFRVYQYSPGSVAELSRISASYVNNLFPGLAKIDCLAAINDGMEPQSSSDQKIPRLTWWNHCGTREWIQYDFSQPTTVKTVSVFWFDDSGSGACRVPQSWRLLYRQGDDWRAVDTAGPFGTRKDAFNRIDFSPVKTNALRLEVQLQAGCSGGILEWKVE